MKPIIGMSGKLGRLLFLLIEMVYYCLTWIKDIWYQLFHQNNANNKGVCFISLPDDTIINILSRLPADTVLSCKLVCRRWLHLCSTPYFAEIHLARATPVTFALHWWQAEGPDMFILENSGRETRFTKVRKGGIQMIHQKDPVLHGSCNGLLLFESRISTWRFLICNPVTREEVVLPISVGMVSGFFFHQLTNEYKLLYCYLSKDKMLHYYVYGLRTKERREIGRSSYFTKPGCAASVHGMLFGMAIDWSTGYDNATSRCSSCIMSFNVDTEDFQVLPHPGARCSSTNARSDHNKMRVMAMDDGKLAFSRAHLKAVEVWVLEDLRNWVWVFRHVVRLDHPGFDPFPCRVDPYVVPVGVLDIQNGELLFSWPKRGLFSYNLQSNAVRKFKTGSKIGMQVATFWSTKYTRSFVSPHHIF